MYSNFLKLPTRAKNSWLVEKKVKTKVGFCFQQAFILN